ncbi:MAG: MbnP family protein [Bacteroidia bacterium]
MNFYSRITLALFMGLTVIISSCKKDEIPNPVLPTEPNAESGMFKIEFEHLYNSAAFSLNSAFTTSEGEEVTWTKLNYYISNIQLTKTDGSTWAEPESYRLVKLEDPISTLITINNVPKGQYTGMSFSIGVDSTRNVSGVQTGALDPANEMFWSWNNGYIFVKSEGTSPQSANGTFSYHLGGFKNANSSNAIQNLNYNFGSSTLDIQPNAAPQIHMTVAVDHFFSHNGSTLKVADLSMLHMPGSMAVGIATRFASGFTFDHIHN